MRKVLILLALLPGLALADSVGGPSTNSGIQTSSPQNNAAGLNVLQPAPNASESNLAAPANDPANALQGSVPSSATQLQVEADGAPQTLDSQSPSNTLWVVLLALAVIVLLAAAVTVWQLDKGVPQPTNEPETAEESDTEIDEHADKTEQDEFDPEPTEPEPKP